MATSLELKEHQLAALDNMHNGCILCGGVGSGKTRTALAYYYLKNGGGKGSLDGSHEYIPMNDPPKDLYIITTAQTRDKLGWQKEMTLFLMSPDPEMNLYGNQIIVDSWNNIQKYKDVKDAFFIFDEQRAVGSGVWAKTFIRISKSNEWIMLSATPGDTWLDYIPVFVANGFYKNRTEFYNEHVIFDPFVRFRKVKGYINVHRLVRLRERILVPMEFERNTVSHHIDSWVDYNQLTYRYVVKERKNPDTHKPIRNVSEYCSTLRRVVNSDESRQLRVLEIFEHHPRLIIFYNFDYELEILRNLYYGPKVEVAEWNGHYHQPIPDSDSWVYLVQYTAGAEGWNCITTDTIIFYSESYSYKLMEQAAGRINRLNTRYVDLYYYHLKSRAPIDRGVAKAIYQKKKFNERGFCKGIVFEPESDVETA